MGRWRKIGAVCVVLAAFVYAAPNIFESLRYEKALSLMPGQSLNLGLDLRGGASLLLAVDENFVFNQRLEAYEQTVRELARLENLSITPPVSQNQILKFEVRNASQVSVLQSLLRRDLGDAMVEVLPHSEGEGEGEAAGAWFHLTLSEEEKINRLNQAVQASIETVRRRIDETGTLGPVVQRQGRGRILVLLPGASDPELVKSLLGRTAKLTFHLISLESRAGATVLRLPSAEKNTDGSPRQTFFVEKRTRVGGENLVDAHASFSDNLPVVSFRFDSEGGRRFANVTRDHVGRLLAIVLDKEVISAPRIQSPILEGSGIITGQFTTEETNELALLLRSGALPVPLTILEERTIGPSLGQDSIAAGKFAAWVSLVLVLGSMLFIYRAYGVAACVALSLNIVLLIGVLTALQASLTLPGIAGIILSIGMAVDANVLIFERMREEQKRVQAIAQRVEAAYKHSLTAIFDANITTLLAGFILFVLGSGPIRGFAVTLTLGICTSVFGALVLTRLILPYTVRGLDEPSPLAGRQSPGRSSRKQKKPRRDRG